MKDLWQIFVIPYMSRLLRSPKRTILFLLIVKKGSMNSQNKSIFTCNQYEKQLIDKKQTKQMNLTQVHFLNTEQKRHYNNPTFTQ
jgi:hypothetical protein